MNKYFGTDGFRGLAGALLTPEKVMRLGFYLGQKSKTIVIGSDPRWSKDMIISALSAGILSAGANMVNLGIVSTPALGYLSLNYDYGIMVSASHNQYFDNGIKVFKNGVKISADEEEALSAFIDQVEALNACQYKAIGQLEQCSQEIEQYIDYICRDIKIINNLPLIIDCANGAVCHIVKKVFAKLELPALFINDIPNGININDQCGALYIDKLKDKYPDSIVAAFDGDGDRLTLLYQNQLLSGDQILYLLAKAFKQTGRLKKEKIVTTIMANSGLLVSLKKYNIETILTSVGDKHVAQALNGLVLGGEQSGHIIINDKLPSGDGILALLEILMALNYTSIDNYLGDLHLYRQKLLNVQVNNQAKILKNRLLIASLQEDQLQLNDHGRILLRPSGTEPVIRVMIEAENETVVDDLLKKYQQLVKLADD